MQMRFKVMGIEEIYQRQCGKRRDRGLGKGPEEISHLEM